MTSHASASSGSISGGCGCLSFIVFCIVVWGLLFGVSYGGKHYGLSCSTDKGVEVK